MQIQITDFNGAGALLGLGGQLAMEWMELQTTLQHLPLFLKASTQQGVAHPIFDPIATNQYIATGLGGRTPAWQKALIPPQFTCWGIDVDFEKNGAIVEVQFSNYPFLLSNTVRSDLFFRANAALNGSIPRVLIVVTKCKMFRASQSTLYYQQAVAQLASLPPGYFTIPVRLIGLEVPVGQTQAVMTTYAGHTSRTVVQQVLQPRTVLPANASGICDIV